RAPRGFTLCAQRARQRRRALRPQLVESPAAAWRLLGRLLPPVRNAVGRVTRCRRDPRSRLPHRVHPRVDCVPVRRLKTCVRAEEGMTLIELLIAMVVMSIGIAALVAGFSSGVVSINRARVTSTAGTLADQQMELYRQAAFTSLPVGLQTPTTPTGPDGHTYWMQVNGAWTCAVGTYSGGPPP